MIYFIPLLFQSCAAWDLFLSDRFFNNVKLQTKSSPVLLLTLSECLSRHDCQTVHWYGEVNNNFVCEVLSTSLCTNPSGVSIKPQPNGRVWEKGSHLNTNATCLGQISTNVPLNCDGITPEVCDHCTRSCRHCWQRYNNGTMLAQYRCTYWPEGVLSTSSLTTLCSTKTPFLVTRKYLNYGVPDPTYYQNMSVFDMARIVPGGAYTIINFILTMKNTSRLSGAYRLQGEGIDEQGRLSVTFMPAVSPQSNTDIFGLMGQSLLNSPFINNTDVLPICGPFWLLPQGNASCPGGGVRFWTSPKFLAGGTVTDLGVYWPSAGDPSNFQRAAITLN